MKIFLGTDHAGFDLKERIKSYLVGEGHTVEDCGALTKNPLDDYPDFVAKAAQAVASTAQSTGIIFGKSGAGECIVANKVNGVRAIVGFSLENVTLARQHNDANILSLGSQFVSTAEAISFVQLFLATDFSREERHIRRIDKITLLEK